MSHPSPSTSPRRLRTVPAPDGTGGAGPSSCCRGFWIPKAPIAQHLIWRPKPATETRNYLKYVFSSFLGRGEEIWFPKSYCELTGALESRGPHSRHSPSAHLQWKPGVQPLRSLTQHRHPIPHPNKSQQSAPARPRDHVNILGGVPPAAMNFGD